MRTSVSNSLRDAITRKSTKNGQSWQKLLGYTVENLMTHLEKQFDSRMNWDNYGKNGWHIDHIKPVTAFSFKYPTDKEFKECWALDNLQPLWWDENIKKGNKY